MSVPASCEGVKWRTPSTRYIAHPESHADGTAKNDAALAKLTSTLDVGGILCTDAPPDGHVAHGVSLILPAADLHQESMGREGESVSGGANDSHAFYNSTSPLTNDTIDELAEDAIRHLELTPSDTACVSITLSHAFGIGSAAAACLSSGASISLPNVDGLHGCGVPSDRAAATLLALEDGATVLYADTHTLKALPEEVNLPQLRTGVCKVASGADFLERSSSLGSTALWTLGKRAEAEPMTRTDALDKGAARKATHDAGARLSGVVKWFDRPKGYGFISPATGGRDIFVHQTQVHACVEINQCVGCTDNSSLSHFSAMTRPRWLGGTGTATPSSRRGVDSARTRRKILISTQVHAPGFRSLAPGEEVEYVIGELNGRTHAVEVTGPGGAFVKGSPPPKPTAEESY